LDGQLSHHHQQEPGPEAGSRPHSALWRAAMISGPRW
jgi:hypothetical protein